MTNIYFQTTGPAVNHADTENMMGLLKEAKFHITTSKENADVIIFNGCLSNESINEKISEQLNNLKNSYQVVILAGCLAQLKTKKFKEYPLIGTKQIDKIVEVVEEAINNNTIHTLDNTQLPPLSLPTIKKNKLIEIIPISKGNDGFCNFCKHKSAQGKTQSYPISDIINRATTAIKYGVKQIWLTSQDTANYGFDINTNLPTLLDELTKIKGDYMIRVGMMNPHNLSKIQNQLIDCYQHLKIFQFLHLPVLAGNNTVLKEMKQKYTVEEFESQVKQFRKSLPQISIMTNILVGFPIETDNHFFQTITCLRTISPEYTNVSKYWEKEQGFIQDNEHNQMNQNEIDRRYRLTVEISQNIARLQHEKWYGWEGEVTIISKGTEDNQMIGFTPSYTKVIIQGDYKLGQNLQVKIVKTLTFSLIAEEVAIKQVPLDKY